MVKSLTLLAVLLLPCLAHAGHGCNQFFVQRQVYHAAYVAPVIVPLIYSTVSPGLANEAQIRAVVREEFRQEQIRQQQQELQQRRPQQLATSILSQKCAKCHAKKEPAGGVFIDGQADVPDQVLRRWLEMAGEGLDVPEAMLPLVKSLKPEDNGRLMSEMLRLKPAQVAASRPQPADRPPPQPMPEGGELK